MHHGVHFFLAPVGRWAKYRLLGDFSLHKPGGAAVGGDIDPQSFHAQSRDLVVGGGDMATARRAYASQVCLLDKAEAARQTDACVCFRVSMVRDELQRADQSGWWPG